MKKCKKWCVIKEMEAICPHCGGYISDCGGEYEKGDEIECEDCGETFLLG